VSGPVLYGSHGKFGLGSLSPGQVASVKEGSRGLFCSGLARQVHVRCDW
jgi:hypothetical protein